ncbi:hypothetical protein ERO13_D12G052300v2 [Gossypium hirsutum]|uniref:BHLH domain-containing protein n=2 Tax=Gossypium TaxID=3633 RepID=A0A5D2S9R3_GOSMU|nr:hypothetical protein ERO13_D12G052300v2 [Gossypium hirsutum]TYG40014.1 hypothetical protein ES288_D12G059300v1 [Gossypium darwinii]TYI49777.1 hypothetical protein E1A91_D12G057300v1 [Gossypium mustelinum]
MGDFRQHVQPMSEMEMTKQQCSELNSTPMENFTIADFSLQTLLAHQLPEFPPILSFTVLAGGSPTATADEHVSLQTNKRKATEQSTCKSQIISPAASTTEFEGNTNTRKKNIRLGKGKKAKEAEEIIHVRARRGQATDSHSLAERVRREKINEKMRCLQDLVPGCHKTMGMAVMLEEIINYVHSLQNQVELAAASSYVETQGNKMAQEGTNSHVPRQQQEMEKWAMDRYGEQHWFHSTWPL